MPRPLPWLFALVLLAAPLTVRAATRLSASATEARSGEVVTFHWSGLPPDVEEVELEYSVAGARWVRLSPELEPHEGEYRWSSPAGVAGRVRVRLRMGERHEESVAAEITLHLVADAQREPAQGVRSADAWDLDRPMRSPLDHWWGHSAPSWSPAHAMPACVTSGASDAPRPEPQSPHVPTSAHEPSAPLDFDRSFVAPRRSPLRN